MNAYYIERENEHPTHWIFVAEDKEWAIEEVRDLFFRTERGEELDVELTAEKVDPEKELELHFPGNITDYDGMFDGGEDLSVEHLTEGIRVSGSVQEWIDWLDGEEALLSSSYGV